MKGVAFDLDGCLVDSTAAIIPSIRVALRQAGLPQPGEAELLKMIGPPFPAAFAELLRTIGADPSRADELVARYRADYREHMLDRTVMVPGVEEAVRAVAAARPVCVVTSKPEPMATPIVEHLGLGRVFRFVVGPSLEALGEPKEATLERAISRLPLRAMVGDRHHDVDAGRAHGLCTVGVTWGIGDADELAGADHLVRDPDQLVALLT